MKRQSLLWELQYESSPISYLFGTMHVKDNRAFEHTQRALNAMYKCSHFKTEINLDEAKSNMDPTVYLLPDGKTISELLGPKKFSKYQRILIKATGLDLSNYDNFLPLIVINKIAELVLKEDKHQALDAYLWSEASKLKLDCDGLETLDEQLAILSSLDLDVQVKMLKELAKNVSKYKKSIEKLSDLYVREDIVKLFKKTKKSLGSLRKVMLYSRNGIMADRICDNISQSCFYAVGAGHLAGDKGVIARLKKKGLKLKAV